MKKKGFTLIELLAVIVIMSILTLILVPIISNVIDSARKAAFRETVNGIIESADNYVGEFILKNHNDPLYPFEIYCNGTECEDSNGKKLEFKGKVPISGKVILESAHLVRAYLISDGVYCGSGTKGNVEVYSKCSELDHTNPIIDESKINDIVISTTTNALTVSFPIDLMYDEETDITGYNVSIYLNDKKVEEKEYIAPYITFTNLKSDTEYKVVITGVNGNNGKTSIDRTATTLDITKPTISYTNDPVSDVNGYFRSQTLNVAYAKGNVENPEYYIRSGRDASTNINVIGSCGNEINPSECTTIDTNDIEADIWYKVSGNINVIYNVNASTESSLTAIIYDGVNYASSDTKIVAKIEASDITAPVITGGSNDWTTTSRTISVSTAGDAFTGVSKYQYYISTSNSSQTDGSWQDVSGTSVTVSTEGTHYVFFRTVSTAGFISSASNSEIVKVDTTGPTTPTGGAIGNVSGSDPTGTIATVASGSIDAGAGGITYKYMVTNSNSAPAKTNTGFTTSRNFTRSCGTSYYAWAIAEDALGNRSEVKALGSTADGADSYSGWSACSASCGGGTQTRTNSCALVTTELSQSCNTQSCTYDATLSTYTAYETRQTGTYTVTAHSITSSGSAPFPGFEGYYVLWFDQDFAANGITYKAGVRYNRHARGYFGCHFLVVDDRAGHVVFRKGQDSSGTNEVDGLCTDELSSGGGNPEAYFGLYSTASGGLANIGQTVTQTFTGYMTRITYSCNAGDTLDGTTCKHYSCPNGGTLSGTQCIG